MKIMTLQQTQPQEQEQQNKKKSNGYTTSYNILKFIEAMNNKQIQFQLMIKDVRSWNVKNNTTLNNESRDLKAIKGVYHDINTFANVDNIVKGLKLAAATVRNHLCILKKLGMVENNTLFHSYYITEIGRLFMSTYENLIGLYPLSYLNMFYNQSFDKAKAKSKKKNKE